MLFIVDINVKACRILFGFLHLKDNILFDLLELFDVFSDLFLIFLWKLSTLKCCIDNFEVRTIILDILILSIHLDFVIWCFLIILIKNISTQIGGARNCALNISVVICYLRSTNTILLYLLFRELYSIIKVWRRHSWFLWIWWKNKKNIEHIVVVIFGFF